jgi:hypothetical protein
MIIVLKLGKKPHQPSAKDFPYKRYKTTLGKSIPVPFGPKATIQDWGMLGNDQYGCCVIAGQAHGIILWTAEGGKPVNFTTQGVLSDYSAITGFNPNDPSTDQGTYLRDALDYGRKVGYVDAAGNRHKIEAFLLLDLLDFNDILEATYLFSSTTLGLSITQTAMNQFNAGEPWTKITDEEILGGHEVELIAYDGAWLYCVTWGKVQKMSVEWFKAYADEAYAKLSKDFLVNGVSPDGFNLAQLQADLAALTPTPHVFSLENDPKTAQCTVGSSVSIKVTTKDTGAPLAGQKVKVECSGIDRFIDTITTDSKGEAVFTIACNKTGEQYCSFSWSDPTECTHYETTVLTFVNSAAAPLLTSDAFISKLETIVDKYRTVYMWGTFGSPVTDALIDQKVAQYPAWYTAARQSLFRSLVGKGYFALDCVGLIKAVLWGWSGDASKSYGGATYASNGVPDTSADGMIDLCSDVSSDFSSILPGEAVWMEGHIGVYLGNKEVIECTPSWAGGVQITACLNIGAINGMNGRTWTKHGKLPYIKYEEEIQMKEAVVYWSPRDYSVALMVANKLGGCGMFCRNEIATNIHTDAMSAKHLVVVGGSEVLNHPNVTNLCGANAPKTAIIAAEYADSL